MIAARTYFRHQKKFLFPAFIHHWEQYRDKLIERIKGLKESVWSGDGRFDSMGHSAKYGTYTMFNNTIGKIAHFELVQASGNSYIVYLSSLQKTIDNRVTDSGYAYITL